MCLSLVACGDPAQTADAAKGAVGSAFQDIVDAANGYMEGPQSEALESHCRAESGAYASSVVAGACEAGRMRLSVDGREYSLPCDSGDGADYQEQCVHFDPEGLPYFNDGPSVPPLVEALGKLSGAGDLGRWRVLFWAAGVNHDYCYHHNGMLRGLSRADCDKQMLEDMAAVCAGDLYRAVSWFEPEACRQHAALAYVAVTCGGEEPFLAQNSAVAYPGWRPAWQDLGLSSSAVDEAMQQRVLKMLQNLPMCEAPPL